MSLPLEMSCWSSEMSSSIPFHLDICTLELGVDHVSPSGDVLLVIGDVFVHTLPSGHLHLGTWSRPCLSLWRCLVGHRRCLRPYPSIWTFAPWNLESTMSLPLEMSCWSSEMSSSIPFHLDICTLEPLVTEDTLEPMKFLPARERVLTAVVDPNCAIDIVSV